VSFTVDHPMNASPICLGMLPGLFSHRRRPVGLEQTNSSELILYNPIIEIVPAHNILI
jgi:hypothetical protein